MIYLPEEARWSYIKKHAKQNYMFVKIDIALSTVEKNNKSLKGDFPETIFPIWDWMSANRKY